MSDPGKCRTLTSKADRQNKKITDRWLKRERERRQIVAAEKGKGER